MAINKIKLKVIITVLIFLCFFSCSVYYKRIKAVDLELKNQVASHQSNNIPPISISVPSNKTVDDNPVDLQFVNPSAPCPAQQLSCFAMQTNKVIDKNCPSYKPLWVYISKDSGSSWLQVGCYATEIDAKKALNKALETRIIKINQSPDPAIVQNNEKSIGSPSINSMQDIFNSQANDTQPVPNQEKTKQETPNTEIKAGVKEDEPIAGLNTMESKPGTVESKENASTKFQQDTDLTVHFKLLFGLIGVEKRTYPDEVMKQKAISMWNKGQRLLEPDGTINEKYAVKTETNNSIIGR